MVFLVVSGVAGNTIVYSLSVNSCVNPAFSSDLFQVSWVEQSLQTDTAPIT